MRAPGPADVQAQRSALHERIDRDFHPHELDDTQRAKVASVRSDFSLLAHEIVDMLDPGRELSLALTHLEDAQDQVIKAIARYP
jgi:hypothetical protein